MAMYKVKITVVKKTLMEDITKKYLTDGENVQPCNIFEVGDTFIVGGMMEPPPNFCPFAWKDIFADVLAISRGGTYAPWVKEDNAYIVCCTDGARPVMFYLERGEEENLGEVLG